MKNENNYEKTRKILEDNIIRLMMEKNLTARARRSISTSAASLRV